MKNMRRVVQFGAPIEGGRQGAGSEIKEVTSRRAECPSAYYPKKKTSIESILVDGGFDLQGDGSNEKDMSLRNDVDAHDCKKLSRIPGKRKRSSVGGVVVVGRRSLTHHRVKAGSTACTMVRNRYRVIIGHATENRSPMVLHRYGRSFHISAYASSFKEVGK
jgi:hypothetical protein